MEVQGEHLNGQPHGLCFLFYKYAGELGPEASTKFCTDPYADGSVFTFKGVATFVRGVLSDGPAFFIQGNGHYLAYSYMKGGRPAL